MPKEHSTAHINQSSRVRSITVGDGDFNSRLTEEEPDCSAVKEFNSAYIYGQIVRRDSVAEPNN
jgi:hypothetical protein